MELSGRGRGSCFNPPSSSQPEDVLSYAPPPAPPLPPPLLLGKPVQRKRRVRSFYWKPIPEERVKRQDRPNLWTLGRHSRETSFHIDIRAIEELFGQHDDTRSPAAADRRMTRGRGSVKDLREQITILDSKRSMNISIFLKHLKKSGDGLLEDVLRGNSESCDVESLRGLLKLLPEDDEVKKLQMFSGDTKDLTPADAFMYTLIHLPRYGVRVEALLLKGEFFSLCSAVKKDITVVRTAITELLNCEELHNILHLVLQAGNIMNDGGFAGNAVGFKLSSLLSLADTKANKPGMNLLHFVALEAQKKNLLMSPEKLQNVQQAARVCVDSIHVELSSLSERVHQVQINIQTDDDLLTQLHSFLKSADEALVDLRLCRDVMVNEGNALIDFFCEDKETFKLDECFHIFQNFCSKFKKAIQENAERGAREESRSKRLMELEDKRHSWAGLEGVGGVFGLRSSSETDVEAALRREGLLDLLRTHPQSALGPPLRFGSVRRSRQQRVNSDLTERRHVTSDPSGEDTHALPPIHSLSITHTHNDTNPTHLHGNHAQEGSTKTKSDHDSNTTHACSEKPKTHTVQETQKHNIQTHTQQDTLRNDEMTFDPSHGNSGECERHNQSESSNRGDGDNDVKLTPQQTNKRSLQSSDRHTRPIQTSSKTSIPKTPEPKHRSSASPKTSSSLSKSPHHRPVRTLTSSETQSLRKVVPISRSGSSGQRKSPVRGASSSGKKKPVTRLPPEEKMCRATLRALGASAPQTSTHASQHRHTPGFARNTVASTTRRAVTPNQCSTSDPKHPPLTRAASLRLSRVLSPQRSPAVTLSKTQSVRLTPPAGHPRMSGGGVSHQSQSKSTKPVWR
ncbi:putative FH2 domain-containing protein 1-like [Triplophysa rosa]|uniref:FH2 domain-containing protein 1-like n=2 Tax=Triplophysa rosa TaxID=992332 RepID=A0A9W7TBC1_TRIRA|nr:putative FH2 domain-containing protein 1-like [Triplophysa rosa]